MTHADEAQNVLRTFLEYRTILFIGCGSGLEDPNFGALLKWASERHGNIPNRHCLLIRDGDDLNHKVLVRLKYGTQYDDLARYLQRLLDEPSTPIHNSEVSRTGKQAEKAFVLTRPLRTGEQRQIADHALDNSRFLQFHKRRKRCQTKICHFWCANLT